MPNTITLTDEQMKALQLGKSITIEPPKPAITRWKPIGGDYEVASMLDGSYRNSGIKVKANEAGLRYKTDKLAREAAKAIRAYARQLAWLAENDDGWVADWNDYDKNKCFIQYSNEDSEFQASNVYQANCISTIYMSQANATKLAKLMNNGIVEF